MDQYIKKSDVVEEIKKLKCKVFDGSSYCDSRQHALRMLEIVLNTLEVKEVDLDKEFDKCCENWIFDDISEFIIAKHFFKLGYNHS